MTTCRCALPAALIAAALATSTSASASPITFATFTEPAASQPFTFTNNVAGTITASTIVNFQFTALTGLPTDNHTAVLTIARPGGLSASIPATALGSLVDQPIDKFTGLSIVEVGTGKTLIAMTFTGDITGKIGGYTADLAGDKATANVVSFASSFLSFSGADNSYNLGLANLSAPLSVGTDGFLDSFTADINGMFVANVVPEPASLSLIAAGSLLLLKRRRT